MYVIILSITAITKLEIFNEVKNIGKTFTANIEITMFFPTFTLSFTSCCFFVFTINNDAKNTRLVKK